MISTLLGSCVAMCLHDEVAKVGGMNHFLLGQPEAGRVYSDVDMQRYGVHAMELLINEMMKKGATRDRLKVHLYGGANMISALGKIGSENSAFALSFVKMEGLQLVHSDLGGNDARRVDFLPFEGRTRCLLSKQKNAPLIRPVAPVAGGNVELF